jgi:hypothetical protein
VSTTTTLPCSRRRGPPLLAHLAAESSACVGSRAPPCLGGAPRPTGAAPCPPERRRRSTPSSELPSQRPFLLSVLWRLYHVVLVALNLVERLLDPAVDLHGCDTPSPPVSHPARCHPHSARAGAPRVARWKCRCSIKHEGKTSSLAEPPPSIIGRATRRAPEPLPHARSGALWVRAHGSTSPLVFRVGLAAKALWHSTTPAVEPCQASRFQPRAGLHDWKSAQGRFWKFKISFPFLFYFKSIQLPKFISNSIFVQNS